MRIFDLLNVDVENTFIFTSYAPTGVPHGIDVYDYLKDAFREDMYVIFLFSRHFYDSNKCIAETGAAWATNKDHSIIVTDVGFGDVDKPINNAKLGLSLSSVESLDKEEAIKFVRTIYDHIGLPVPDDKNIRAAIEKAIVEFKGKLGTASFYPKRKYQGYPICSDCGSATELKKDATGLHFGCRNPGCSKKINADIH